MDANGHIAAVNRVNGTLAALMRRRKITTAACLAVYNPVLVPTLLYGSEMWILQKKNEKKMNAMEMRSSRRICRVSLADRVRNEDVEIYRMASTSEDVTVKMKRMCSADLGTSK